MTNTKISLLSGLLLLMPVLLQAQYLKSYIGPSPNAASLGTYGQIPVSEYSGVPNIQIPLYSIETEGFSMPISLTYHASALKNSDDASWVGFGWSLNAGGVITRSKRDRNDFGANGYFTTGGNQPCSDGADQEPDMFYYNIGSRSGRFMILGASSNPTIRYFTRDNIRITYNSGVDTWSLVTGEGITYYFTKYERTNETITGETSGSESYVSSWYVTSIHLVNGSIIKFNYLTPNNTRITQSITWGEDDYASNYWPSEAAHSCCISGQNLLRYQGSRSTNTVNIDEVILSTIEFPNGVIKLNTSARADLEVQAGTAAAKKLDNIQVFSLQNNNEKLIKTFSFNYDYYSSYMYPGPVLANSRLRLRNVTESTPAATSKPYILNYSADVLLPKSPGSTNFLGTYGLLNSIVYPTGGSSLFVWEQVQFELPQTSWPTLLGARIKKIYDNDQFDSSHVRWYEYSGSKLMGYIRPNFPINYPVYQTLYNCCQYGEVQFSCLRTKTIYADFSSLGSTANGYVFGHDKVITWYGENGEYGKKEAIFENTAPGNPNYFQGQIPVPVPLDVPNKNGLLKDEWEYRNDNGAFTPVRHVINTYASADVVTTPARRYAFNKCDWAYNITTEWVQQTDQAVYTYDRTGSGYVLVNTQFFYDDADNALPTRVITTDSKNNPVRVINYYAKEKAAQSGGLYTTMLNKHIISPVLEQETYRNSVLVSKTTTAYKDWFNNGRVIKPETVSVQKGSNAAETMVRYHGYDEQGNVLAMSKEKGKTVSYVWGYGNAYPIAEVTNVDYETRFAYPLTSYDYGTFLNLTENSIIDFRPFTTNHGQTINFSIRFMPIVTMGTYNGSVEVALRNSAGQYLYLNVFSQDGTYTGSANLADFTNSYYFTTKVRSVGINTHLVRVEVRFSYDTKSTLYNYFHTSFEELTSDFIEDGKTGRKCIKGPYFFSSYRKPGNYVLSWWQKPVTGGDWIYQEQLISITGGSPNITVGNSNFYVDEVRLYPHDAFMTTYTYQPQVGMTSKCDERGQVTYYEYDALNRLKVIRDNNYNIINLIEYNYKDN